MHRWFGCVRAQAMAALRGALGILADARAAQFHPTCLWECGLVPSEATRVPISEPMRQCDERREPGHLAEWLHDTGQVIEAWTDGSCSDQAVEVLRRAGWACVFPDWAGATTSAPLAGRVQLSFRAELRAVVHAAEITAGRVHVVSDCWAVVTGACAVLRGNPVPSEHRDLWLRFLAAAVHGLTRVSWVRAHQDEPPAGVPYRHWLGNRRADRLADAAAAAHVVAPHDRQRVLRVRQQAAELHAWQALVLEDLALFEAHSRGGRSIEQNITTGNPESFCSDWLDAGGGGSLLRFVRRLTRRQALAYGRAARLERDVRGARRLPASRTVSTPLSGHRLVRAVDDGWCICVDCGRIAAAARGPRAWGATPCAEARGRLPRLLEYAPDFMLLHFPTAHVLTRQGRVVTCSRCGRFSDVRTRARWCGSTCRAAAQP